MTRLPSSVEKSGIYWTQFPAEALTGRAGAPIDWGDHHEAHRAVSRLFSPQLPGPQTDRRHTAGILYRVDANTSQGGRSILVQSLVPPELTPPESRTTEVSRRKWELSVGDRVAFRVSVNPVMRTTRYYTDARKSELEAWSNKAGRDSGVRSSRHIRRTEKIIPISQLEGWLNGKLGGALVDVQLLSHFRDASRSGRHKVVVDTFDATAEVQDPARLDSLRVAGVGRAKSYGCGLLTAVRLGES